MDTGREDEEDTLGSGGGEDEAGLLDEVGGAFMGGGDLLGIEDVEELLEAGLLDDLGGAITVGGDLLGIEDVEELLEAGMLDDLGGAIMVGGELLGIEDVEELLEADMLPMVLDEEWATELGGGAFELVFFPEFTNGTLGSQPGTRSVGTAGAGP